MTSIMSISEQKLNDIFPNFGTAIVQLLTFYKDNSYVMLHQASVTELANHPMFHNSHKQVLHIMLQSMTANGHAYMQIVKTSS